MSNYRRPEEDGSQSQLFQVSWQSFMRAKLHKPIDDFPIDYECVCFFIVQT